MPLKTDPISQANEAYKNELRRRDNEIRALGTEIEDLKKQKEVAKKEIETLQVKVSSLKTQVSTIEGDLAARRKEFDATQDKLRGVLADKEQSLLQSASAQTERAKSLDLRHSNASDREHQVEVKKALLANILNKLGENIRSVVEKEVEQIRGI